MWTKYKLGKACLAKRTYQFPRCALSTRNRYSIIYSVCKSIGIRSSRKVQPSRRVKCVRKQLKRKNNFNRRSQCALRIDCDSVSLRPNPYTHYATYRDAKIFKSSIQMIPFTTILNPCVVMTCVVHISRCINEWHCAIIYYI